MRRLPKKMPHLEGAKRLRAMPGQRLCVHEAAGFVMDVPGATLCFGTFRAATPEELAADPTAATEPFIHAWVEWQGKVWSPTLMAICPVEEYYAANDAKNVKRLPRPALLALARRIGLSRHLRLGVPTRGGASVGMTLLDAAGVAHRTTPDGGLVPADPDSMEPRP